jgi:hypothetical protein
MGKRVEAGIGVSKDVLDVAARRDEGGTKRRAFDDDVAGPRSTGEAAWAKHGGDRAG